jgi:hypothetical protein
VTKLDAAAMSPLPGQRAAAYRHLAEGQTTITALEDAAGVERPRLHELLTELEREFLIWRRAEVLVPVDQSELSRMAIDAAIDVAPDPRLESARNTIARHAGRLAQAQHATRFGRTWVGRHVVSLLRFYSRVPEGNVAAVLAAGAVVATGPTATREQRARRRLGVAFVVAMFWFPLGALMARNNAVGRSVRALQIAALEMAESAQARDASVAEREEKVVAMTERLVVLTKWLVALATVTLIAAVLTLAAA